MSAQNVTLDRGAADDHVVAAAHAARADYIVSGDLDLLSLGNFQGIRIMTAAGLLAHVEA